MHKVTLYIRYAYNVEMAVSWLEGIQLLIEKV